MQQHAVIGDRLCGELRSLRQVRPIVRHHHERLRRQRLSRRPARRRHPAARADHRHRRRVRRADDGAPVQGGASRPIAACAELIAEAQRGWHRRDLVDAFIALARRGGEPCARLADSPVGRRAASREGHRRHRHPADAAGRHRRCCSCSARRNAGTATTGWDAPTAPQTQIATVLRLVVDADAASRGLLTRRSRTRCAVRGGRRGAARGRRAAARARADSPEQLGHVERLPHW